MKAHLTFTPLGVLAYDENGSLADKELFPRNGKEAAQRLLLIQNSKALPELQKLYSRLKGRYSEISLEHNSSFGTNTFLETPNPAGKSARKVLFQLAQQFNFQNFQTYLHELNSEFTRQTLKKELKSPDKTIIQIAGALDEISDSLNLLSERLREWYSLSFPEMSSSIKDNESYSKILSRAKSRANVQGKLAELLKTSIGIEFEESDFNEIRKFASALNSFYNEQEQLASYLSKLMQKNFPNLNTVAGAKIGAKLIACAGDSKRLAVMPSSTIQLLGAEKALFRHLKTGAKSPKYGVILHHNLLQNAPKKLRGKIARALAAKISIAIKKDVYSKEFIGEKLRQDLDKKIERILKK